MKAIQQLIGYFEDRGQLTPRQVQQLVARGFYRQYTAGDLHKLEQQIGQSYIFQAIGNTQGPLWGTDTYTSDSNLGTACVHAGVLKPSENGLVKVTIVKPLPVFQASTRNGITSHAWSTGWHGAFQVERVNNP
jgi:hypothetical protein